MREFTRPSDVDLAEALAIPERRASVVFDTDTFNEIDDQYAVVYAELAPNIDVEAVYAAPFFNERSNGPADGMEKSYEEILRLVDKLRGLGQAAAFDVLKGARRYLADDGLPVASDAVADLVERARAQREGRLYVVAIGAPTNVASALIEEPSLRDKIVVVWLGGQPYDWPTAWEFNLKQDLISSQVLFDSGVPLVHIPCKNVAEHLRTTVPELDHLLRGKNPLGDYLFDITSKHIEEHGTLSKVIWDIAPVAWLRRPELVATHLGPSPILTDRFTWSRDPARHLLRVAYDVDRDAIFRDLFGLLETAGGHHDGLPASS